MIASSLRHALQDSAAHDAPTQAHFSCFGVGRGLATAPPSEYEDKGVPLPLFRVALLTRLRPLVMHDKCKSLFARCVPTIRTVLVVGSVVLRHTCVRDQLFKLCRVAALRVDK
eukprot:1920251-Amphidinium_carterae.1